MASPTTRTRQQRLPSAKVVAGWQGGWVRHEVAYGRVTAAVMDAGRRPRRRTADLMIAATAIAAGLPLFTTNPGDFAGLAGVLAVVPVTRPQVPRER